MTKVWQITCKALLPITFWFFTSCDKNNNNNNNNNNQGNQQNNCQNCGPNNGNEYRNDDISATANLTGAYGLLVIDKSNQAALALMDKHNETADKLQLTTDRFDLTSSASLGLADENGKEQANYSLNGHPFRFPAEAAGLGLTDSSQGAAMQKIDSTTGEIKDALTQDPKTDANNNMGGPSQVLPKLRTLAVSPKKDVFLHFENAFVYRKAKQSEDPWNISNGFQCQIFKVKGGTLDDLLTQAPTAGNLECVDNSHFIDSWRTFPNGVFQFDSDGALYYPGSIPNANKMVVYRKSRDLSETREVINANICVNNFLITNSGGVFYTGQTCQDGNNGNSGGGGGFFRYIAPGANGQVIEIARDWWNFIYNAAVSEDNIDLAVFFGPDPRNATTASWDSACLFNFDPSQDDPSTRIANVITCGNDIWSWMDMRRAVDVTDYGEGYNNYTGTDRNHSPSLAWKKEYKRRCETKDQVFAGGGSQINAIQQDSTGEIYVIGNIRKKAEGLIRCNVEIRGPHCTINAMPVLTDDDDVAYTETSCTADKGIWVNSGNCGNGSKLATGCIDHTRTWTPGYCSNSDYDTKAACEAAKGCSNRWINTDNGQSESSAITSCTNAGYTWHDGTTGNGLVWRTGRCDGYQDQYETQATCEAANHTWQVDNWSGSCTTTGTDNAKLFNNNKNSCIPTWQADVVQYSNVTGSICVASETGDRSSWWEWGNKKWNYAQTADNDHQSYTQLANSFIINNLGCYQADSSTNWTTEYSALAKVDKTAKSLVLMSLASEKAINLWVVDDKPYYSSFDTSLGKYLLSGLATEDVCLDTKKNQDDCTTAGLDWNERQCNVTSLTTKTACQDGGYTWASVHPKVIMTNFETYNLASAASETSLWADGLDFSTNQYKFGTVSLEDGTLSLTKGLTGTLKTIIILPKD